MTPSCKAWVNFLYELWPRSPTAAGRHRRPHRRRARPRSARPLKKSRKPQTRWPRPTTGDFANQHMTTRSSCGPHRLPGSPGQKSLQEIGFRAHHGQPISMLCPVGLQMACLTARFSARRRRRPGCSWGYGRGPTRRIRFAWPSPGPPAPGPVPTPAASQLAGIGGSSAA